MVPLHPSILGACKQLHDEGVEILYRKNSFLLDEPVNAIQFFTREFQGSRSLITDITLNLRELALSILHWGMTLENVPAGLSSLTIIQYDFLEYCRHIHLKSPVSSLVFCAGCGFTHFARDHPVEQYLPSALAGRIRYAQGPQCLIRYALDASPHVSHQEAQVRREELKEIVARRVGKIYNRS